MKGKEGKGGRLGKRSEKGEGKEETKKRRKGRERETGNKRAERRGKDGPNPIMIVFLQPFRNKTGVCI